MESPPDGHKPAPALQTNPGRQTGTGGFTAAKGIAGVEMKETAAADSSVRNLET